MIPSASRVLCSVLSVKHLPASRAGAILVEFTVWLLRKGQYNSTNCRAFRRNVVVSRTTLIEKVMLKPRSPGYKVPAEHIPDRTVHHGMRGSKVLL